MAFDEVVSQIKGEIERRKKIAQIMKQNVPFFNVPKVNLSGMKIAGVDGGFLEKRMHGISFIVRRAVGVVFSFSNSGIEAKYFPSKTPHPEVIAVSEFMEEHEFNTYASLLRVEREVKTALELAKKFKPDMLILDGSVVLYPSNRPKSSAFFFSKYREIIEAFKELYSFCIESNILLAGAVEDSRSIKLCKKIINDDNALCRVSDTVLLSYSLGHGERTDFFEYSESDELPILQDLGSFSKNLFSFYIMPSKFDSPLRIDFLSKSPQQDISKISSIILSISGSLKDYAYPSVLIEADARAKLSERDLLFIQNTIKSKIPFSQDLFDLRRERRKI